MAFGFQPSSRSGFRVVQPNQGFQACTSGVVPLCVGILLRDPRGLHWLTKGLYSGLMGKPFRATAVGVGTTLEPLTDLDWETQSVPSKLARKLTRGPISTSILSRRVPEPQIPKPLHVSLAEGRER